MRISSNAVQTPELQQFLQIFMAATLQRGQRVQAQRDLLDVRSSIFSDLKSKLTTLMRAADDFGQKGSLSPFAAKKATISNDNVLGVTAGAGASTISHSIHIDQLARPHSVISKNYTATGTELSAAHTGTKNFSISVGGTAYAVAVTIASGDTNKTVLDAISTAISGVTGLPVTGSSVANTDTTVRFSIASDKTGTTNKMTFTDTDGLLGTLGVTMPLAATDTAGGYVYADLGGGELDAKLTVDGISVVRSSNSLSDVIAGVTLDLRAAQKTTDADVSIGLEVDKDAIKERVEAFLKDYNEAVGFLRSKTQVDISAEIRGPLAGDFTYSNLLQRVRLGAFGSVSSPSDPALTALSQIGIRSSESGELTIADSNLFEEKLGKDILAVESLFNSTDGVGIRLESLLKDYTKATGIINASQDAVSDRIDNIDDRLDRLQEFMERERSALIDKFGKLQQATQMQASMMATLNAIFGSSAF